MTIGLYLRKWHFLLLVMLVVHGLCDHRAIAYASEALDGTMSLGERKKQIPVYRSDIEESKRRMIEERQAPIEPSAAPFSHPEVSDPTGLPVRKIDWGEEAKIIRSRIPQSYVRPSPEEKRAFASILAKIISGNYMDAESESQKIDYSLEELHSDGGRFRAVALIERPRADGTMRGWGSYFFNSNSSAKNIVIEAPHPTDDIGTPELAANIFSDSNARAYLLSGSDRDYADAAHDPGMIFNEVHQIVSQKWKDAIVCQIHGFSQASHPDLPRGTQAVISNVDGSIAEVSENLDTTLRSKGIHGFIYNQLPANHPKNRELNDGHSGDTFSSLAATTNLQWNTSRPPAGKFVHIELSYDVRNTTDLARRASGAVAIALQRSIRSSVE